MDQGSKIIVQYTSLVLIHVDVAIVPIQNIHMVVHVVWWIVSYLEPVV